MVADSSEMDIVLAKYSAAGDLQWSRLWSGSSYLYPTAMVTDPVGAVIVAGRFYGTVNFGGGPLSSVGGYSLFLVKYSGSGQHLWSRAYGGSGSIFPADLAMNAQGELLVAGYLSGTTDLGGGARTSVSNSKDIFLAKYAADGRHLWSKLYGGSGDDRATAVAVDSVTGDIVLTGWFNGSIDFGSGALVSAGGEDAFVAMVFPAGDPLWSRRYGGTGLDEGRGVGIDASGNVVLGAVFSNTVNFGGANLTSNSGSLDIALAQYSASGAHQWSKRFGSSLTDMVEDLAVNPNGDIAMTGISNNGINLGGANLLGNGSYDVLLAKYTSTGAHVWSKRAGALYDDRPGKLAIDDAGEVTATGYFIEKVDFGNGELVNVGGGTGGADGFLVRFAP